MPWHVEKSTSCPASKPWACVKDADGEIEGCHATEAAARRQVAALYAQEALRSMDVQHKSFNIVETKATGSKGQFTAIVSVFGNVDSVGDRINPGSYTKTLEKWRLSGDPIPIILSHQWNDVMSHVGIAYAKDIKQTPKGLLVNGMLDVDDNPVARQVHKLLKRRSLREFSIGYRVPKGGEQYDDGTGVNDIYEIDLVECGPTLKGANDATELLGVKSALAAITPKAPPRSEEELRRQAAMLERAELEKALPDIAPALERELAQAEPEEDEEAPPETDRRDPPPPDDDLRRRADALERERLAADLPPYQVEPPPASPPPARPAEPLPVPTLPASARELRRRSELLTREQISEALPDIPVLDPPKSAPAPAPAPPPRLPAPEHDLRRRSDRLDRDQVELPEYEVEQSAPTDRSPLPPPRLPATDSELRKRYEAMERSSIAPALPEYEVDPPPPPPEPEPREPLPPPRLPASHAELRRRQDALERAAIIPTLPDVPLDPPPPKAAIAPAPPPRLPAGERELRRRADRVARERVDLPDVKLDPAAPEPPAPPTPTVPPPRLPAREPDLRRRAEREERAELEKRLPDYELDPPAPDPEPNAEPATYEELSRRIEALERERISKALPDLPPPLEPEPVAPWEELFPPDELEGARTFLKAVWTTTYINDLPDACFLYVEPGGEKDADGKMTPRSLRHFPVKDVGGVDLPHLRNALSRIPQSDLPQSVKDQCVVKARQMMDATKSDPALASAQYQGVSATREPGRVQPRDDLRRRSLQTVLEVQSDGVSTRAQSKATPEQLPPPPSDEGDLRRRSRDAILQVLTGE